MKLYLDNCCYNRPYDDQSYIRISLESQAKLFIQQLIRKQKVDMVSSFILEYENMCNPYLDRKNAIADFLKLAKYNVGSEYSDFIKKRAREIMKTGVKMKDACHIACAEFSECDYLLSTDDRMLKFKSNVIQLVNPIDFLRICGSMFEKE